MQEERWRGVDGMDSACYQITAWGIGEALRTWSLVEQQTIPARWCA